MHSQSGDRNKMQKKIKRALGILSSKRHMSTSRSNIIYGAANQATWE